MHTITIHRNCKYYDYGRTAPRIYGAYCELHRESLGNNICKDCKEIIPIDGWIEDHVEMS